VAELADLQLVKAHLHVDHDDHDPLIEIYLQAASDHVLRHHDVPEPVPADVAAAVLLMVGDLYANRETVAAGAVQAIPMSTTVGALLSAFRRWSF
jgi:uncharacterized phage protein (predicted DNA packaging)